MKYLFTSLIFFIGLHTALAQQELTLHLMKDVFQSTHTNPAFRARTKGSVTMLSSFQANVRNTGFTYDQLITASIQEESGKRFLDYGEMYSNLNLTGNDNMYIGFSFDAFALSFKVGKNRFSLNATEHVLGRIGYGEGLFKLIAEGNTPGETISLSDYNLNATQYHELGLGYNRSFLEDKLVIGTRLKMLYGLANVTTRHFNAQLTTGTEAELYEITTALDFEIQTSGTSMGDDDIINNYLFNTQNNGFAIDLGATYKYDDKLSFSASVLNLGAINWNSDVRTYSSNGEFKFSGLTIDSLFSGDDTNFDQSQMLDSLKDEFDIQKDSLSSYKTSLPMQSYLTAYYNLGIHTTASATIYTSLMEGKPYGAFALGIQQQVGKWLNVTGTYSMQGRSFGNIGVGLGIKSGGFQLYAVTDNALAFVIPTKSKIGNARVGFNIVF